MSTIETYAGFLDHIQTHLGAAVDLQERTVTGANRGYAVFFCRSPGWRPDPRVSADHGRQPTDLGGGPTSAASFHPNGKGTSAYARGGVEGHQRRRILATRPDSRRASDQRRGDRHRPACRSTFHRCPEGSRSRVGRAEGPGDANRVAGHG